eukprot:TRINITY_DN73028_c0_g1_i1.p1 TRINITY_DN73028_c0_g1~~TRINITY_DN73028_c0_g1_i1.p1  ORF type:complete len:683 (-),score=93.20 TRINITY_DN73028_c0_g1_i1:19-2067(-)
MFKENGTKIRDPRNFVAAMAKTGGYRGGLFDEDKNEIDDPVEFLKTLEDKGELPAPEAKRSRLTHQALARHERDRSRSRSRDRVRSSRSLFKDDGTEIKNPARYVEAMERTGGYRGGLFDSKGNEIRDPIAYVARTEHRSDGSAASSRPARKTPGSLYKQDGTEVRDPVRYVEAMERTGGYKGGLFDSRGNEIRDPRAYVARMDGSAVSSMSVPRSVPQSAPRSIPHSVSARSQSGSLFKEDGTEVRDPVRYVEAMQRSGGYKGGLFDSRGIEIRDPVAYVARMEGSAASSAGDPARKSSGGLYKEDGTEIRDPVRYVEAMQKSGGYKGGLFDSKGNEIRDPAAYVARMGVSAPSQKVSAMVPYENPRRPAAPIGGPIGSGERSGPSLFKEDGTPVKNPARYVEAMEKSGGYKGGLFDAKGTEIRDPIAYLARANGSASSSSRNPPSLPALRAGPPGGARPGSLFKEDGTEIRDPVRYVEAMERSGGYNGGLFDSRGNEIKNPVAYVARFSGPAAPAPAPSFHGPTKVKGVLYKQDGTEVKNPARYVEAMEKTGGYKGGLFDYRGNEIRDPVAYVAKMDGPGRSGGSDRASSRGGGSVRGSAANSEFGDTEKKPGCLYKEDGTEVKNPARYVAAMEKSGGYRGGLFNHEGEEIADPIEYVEDLLGPGAVDKASSSFKRSSPY